MNSDPEQPDKRQASDVDGILDDLAGIDAAEGLSIPEEDDSADSPLSEGLVDQTIATVRRLQASGRTVQPRRWWLRPAAILPLSIVLLGSVPTYFGITRWSGKEAQKNLTYEEAHHVAFDGHYSVQSRYVAVGRISGSIKRGILEMRKAMAKTPKLAGDGKAVLRGIEDMIADAKLARGGKLSVRGSFQKILDSLMTETEVEKQRKTFIQFLGASKTGIAIIHRASVEPGYLGTKSKSEFPRIKGLITRKLKK